MCFVERSPAASRWWYMKDVGIPTLTAQGLLPLGVHDATLDEIVETFGTSNPRRQTLAASLTRFVGFVTTFGLFTRYFVDGSFTTDKDVPGDVDIVLQLPTSKMKELSAHDRWAELEREAVKKAYEIDLLLEPTEAGTSLMVDFFQTLKPKDVVARKVTATHRRGILKVQL